MAFDGITIANVVKECQDRLTGGRIYKIAQPEKDELLLTIKANGGQQYRLFLSADASLPLIYLTEHNKPSPMTAPNFCMLLRKHLQNARIVGITQPGLERIVRVEVEHLNELGDLCRKFLITEIMGKHSNIIFCDEKNVVIDSIKHISGMVSSVREVLPGKDYFVPETQEKKNPLEETAEGFVQVLKQKEMPLFKALYTSYTGFSPVIASEICHLAGAGDETVSDSLNQEQSAALYKAFEDIVMTVKNAAFEPVIIYDGREPVEYAALPLLKYVDKEIRSFQTMSELLEHYYAEKNTITRIRQKSADLRRILQTAGERSQKKYALQMKQMQDTEKKEQYRVYGELLNTYGYGVEEGAASMEALNYYTGETITIPLNTALSTGANAKKYFDRYNKLKRTYEALAVLTKETKEEIKHLESVAASLEMARGEEDLVQIKEELTESGYIRRRNNVKKVKVTSRPFHYVSSDGFSIYVGKNNYQNDELTFQFATGNDWWFHTKGIPGSHVILKANGDKIPDRAFEEAGRLAAYYSKGRGQEKIEIDYTEKKNVKKPSGGKPGFVIYHTNYSMTIDADITGLKEEI